METDKLAFLIKKYTTADPQRIIEALRQEIAYFKAQNKRMYHPKIMEDVKYKKTDPKERLKSTSPLA